jgi:hypothetical protein
MWVLVLLLNLLGRKNFLRFLAGWMLIMLFFLYCFVHDAFDQPRPTQRVMVPRMERRPVKPVSASTPEH